MVKLTVCILSVLAVVAAPCRGQGIITTVAGNGALGFSGDGGPATNAALNLPSDLALDSKGNLYICDRGNNRIRKVDPAGNISTFAGNGSSGSSGDGGPATNAALFLPAGVAVDAADNVYIADNSRIRKVDAAGVIRTVAGGGFDSRDGINALNSWLGADFVAVDAAGNIYTTDVSNIIRKVNTSGIISIFAGAGGGTSFSGDGGPARNAAINNTRGLTVDAAGNAYIADSGNGRIRKVDTSGIITTVAGDGISGYAGDGGPAISARLGFAAGSAHQGVAVDKAGNLYIADVRNNRIRKVDTAGIITTVAGNGTPFSGLTVGDGGLATMASVLQPNGVVVDSAGNLYIADTNHNRIRKVTPGAATSNPTISANGVVNGASFRAPIAPNSWVTILGSNLAPKTDDWGNSVVGGKLPPSLDGVSVSIGGKPAYVNFISPGQLNVLAPDLGPGTVSVTVMTPSGTSAAVMATVSQYSPAFFSWPGSQPVATRQDFSFAARVGTFAGLATVPAKPGDVIILWGTGFGPTAPAAPVGVTTPADQTYSTAALPEVTINSIPVTVYGAALAPGFAGLYQVAIQVPESLADGDWPVQASIGGVQSPAGTVLSVRR